VWYGEEVCLTYCVLWNTRKARLAKKSRAVSRPAAGRSVKPVCSAKGQKRDLKRVIHVFLCCYDLVGNHKHISPEGTAIKFEVSDEP
jgi:hypothetical protein